VIFWFLKVCFPEFILYRYHEDVDEQGELDAVTWTPVIGRTRHLLEEGEAVRGPDAARRALLQTAPATQPSLAGPLHSSNPVVTHRA
jgi:hypothetical protein